MPGPGTDDGKGSGQDEEVAGGVVGKEKDVVVAGLTAVAVGSGGSSLVVICEVDDAEGAKHSQSNDRNDACIFAFISGHMNELHRGGGESEVLDEHVDDFGFCLTKRQLSKGLAGLRGFLLDGSSIVEI